MNRIAEELDAKLRTLDEVRAGRLSLMVRDAMRAVEQRTPIDRMLGVENGWPEGYFAEHAGSLAGERFERETQGELPDGESW